MLLQIPFSSKGAPDTGKQLRNCRKLPLMASCLTISYILNLQQQASIYVVERKKRKRNPCYLDYSLCMLSNLSKGNKSYLTCLPTLKVQFSRKKKKKIFRLNLSLDRKNPAKKLSINQENKTKHPKGCYLCPLPIQSEIVRQKVCSFSSSFAVGTLPSHCIHYQDTVLK